MAASNGEFGNVPISKDGTPALVALPTAMRRFPVSGHPIDIVHIGPVHICRGVFRSGAQSRIKRQPFPKSRKPILRSSGRPGCPAFLTPVAEEQWSCRLWSVLLFSGLIFGSLLTVLGQQSRFNTQASGYESESINSVSQSRRSITAPPAPLPAAAADPSTIRINCGGPDYTHHEGQN
jgi:hypothetical protein